VENVERVLAGLIILALLALLILIAIPVNRADIPSVPRTSTQDADRRSEDRHVRQPPPATEPERRPQPDRREARLENGTERTTDTRSDSERRDIVVRTCGNSCDCCCGAERRRTTERRRTYRREPVRRYDPDPDEPYWVERRWRPARNRPYWAEIPVGACPE
jgi:hypothetical protein